MHTNGIVKEQHEKMINGHLINNGKLSDSHHEETEYSFGTTILGNPIELIRQNSYNPSSFTKAGKKASMQGKTSIFSKVKTFFKI